MKSTVKIVNTLLIGGFLLGIVTNVLGANNDNIFQSPQSPFGNELLGGGQTSLNLEIAPPETSDPSLPSGGNAAPPQAGVPVDGGLSILLLAGAGLGARRMRKSLKRKM